MSEADDISYSRRAILKGGVVATAATLLGAQPALASVYSPWSFFGFGRRGSNTIPYRSLNLEHLHTGERLNITYAENGYYIPESLHEINYLLRDFRSGEIKSIDPQLLDALCDAHNLMETDDPFQVVSGYRSPATNAMLRSHSDGVAQNSYHIRGRAIDVCVQNRTPLQIRNAALALRRGGVGYYPGEFVHIDTGPVRRW